MDESNRFTDKEYLRQYDNYGLYDFYCIDRPKRVINDFQVEPYIAFGAIDSNTYSKILVKRIYAAGSVSNPGQEISTFNNFIAVQHYHIECPIFRFNTLIERYFDRPSGTKLEGTWAYRAALVGAFSASPIFNDRGQIIGFESRGGDFDVDTTGAIVHTTGGSGGVGLSLFKYAFWNKTTNYDILDIYPNYSAFISGYTLDNRSKPTGKVRVTATADKQIKIAYYAPNRLENYPGLTTIDYHTRTIYLKKDEPTYIYFDNCCLSSFWVSDPEISAQIASYPSEPNCYGYADFLVGSDSGLFSQWVQIHSQLVSEIPPLGGTVIEEFSSGEAIAIRFSQSQVTRDACILRKIGATNNYWLNDNSSSSDIGYDANHPMFKVDLPRESQYYLEPINDSEYGTLIMDSPRLIEIHAALDAANFATNRIDSDRPRITNLGHLIAKNAELMGYRANDDGKYIVAEEQERVRRGVKGTEIVDEAEYGGNYFASKGMLVRRVPNAFNAQGEIVSGGVAMVHDVPQLLAEIQDQLSIALNLQESGAIEIKDGDRTYRYSGQLQLLTDLALGVAGIHQLVHQGYISSLVTQQQSGEIIAGMGLPTVNRVTNIAIDNKLEQIPYWGIAPQHSLARKIDTVAYNVGIVTGQLI